LAVRHKAWFGDLGDGVHKGDENDPRISLIEVTPDEVRRCVFFKQGEADEYSTA
jgi:hypothetical protein